MAARWNSSLAPVGPRNLRRPSPRMRLRCAKSISTFFLSLEEISYSSVSAISRAMSLAPSWIDRRSYARAGRGSTSVSARRFRSRACSRGSASCHSHRPRGAALCRLFGADAGLCLPGMYRRRTRDRRRSLRARTCHQFVWTCRRPGYAAQSRALRSAIQASGRPHKPCLRSVVRDRGRTDPSCGQSLFAPPQPRPDGWLCWAQRPR